MKDQNSFTDKKQKKSLKPKNNPFNIFNNNKPNTNCKYIDKKTMKRNKTSTSTLAIKKNKSSTLSMTKPASFLKETISKLFLKMSTNLQKYNCSIEKLNKKIITDIIFNENKRVVSIFKDYLIWDESSEFFKKCFNLPYITMMLPKISAYYENYTKYFPVYSPLEDILHILSKNMSKKRKYLEMLEENENKIHIKKNLDFTRLIDDAEITATKSEFLDSKIKNNIEYINKKVLEESTLKIESLEKDFIFEGNDNINNSINDRNVSKELYDIIQSLGNNNKNYINKKLRKNIFASIAQNNIKKSDKKLELKINNNNMLMNNIKKIKNNIYDIIDIKQVKNQNRNSLSKIKTNKNILNSEIITRNNNTKYTFNKSPRQRSCLEKQHKNILNQITNNKNNNKKNSNYLSIIRMYKSSKSIILKPRNIKKLIHYNSENNYTSTLENVTSLIPNIRYKDNRINSCKNYRKQSLRKTLSLKRDRNLYINNINKRVVTKTKTSPKKNNKEETNQKKEILKNQSKKQKISRLQHIKINLNSIDLINDFNFVDKKNFPTDYSIEKNNISKITPELIKISIDSINRLSPKTKNKQSSPSHFSIINNLRNQQKNFVNPFRTINSITLINNFNQCNNINNNLVTNKNKLMISSLLSKKTLKINNSNFKGKTNTRTKNNSNTKSLKKEKVNSNIKIDNKSNKREVKIIKLNKKYNLNKVINTLNNNISRNLYNKVPQKSSKETLKTKYSKNLTLMNEIKNNEKINKNISENYRGRSKDDINILSNKNPKKTKFSGNCYKNKILRGNNSYYNIRFDSNRRFIKQKYTINTQIDGKNNKDIISHTDRFKNKKKFS